MAHPVGWLAMEVGWLKGASKRMCKDPIPRKTPRGFGVGGPDIAAQIV